MRILQSYLDFQLVEDHFPDAWEASARAALACAHATVRHLVVQRVRPNRRIAEGSGHAGVVNKAKLLHHEKLAIPANAQERHADTADVLHVNASEAIDDVSLADHLVEPVLNSGVSRPPALRMPMPNYNRSLQNLLFLHF